jgi:hypothetical protein
MVGNAGIIDMYQLGEYTWFGLFSEANSATPDRQTNIVE